MSNFWNLIVESNTFNFAVLLIIFAILYKKLNVSILFENMKLAIIKTIDEAKAEREKAKLQLDNAKNSVANLDNELQEKMKDANSRAKVLSKQIEDNAQGQVSLIEKSLNNLITSEEKKLSAQMTDEMLQKSIELAKGKIVEALKNNPQLHEKFINESIGEI